MKSNYKPLGNYIREVKKRNTDLKVTNLIGLSTQKEFRISISNIIGTDLSTYKIIGYNNFVYMPVTDTWKGLAVALYKDNVPKIVSQIYKVFEIIDTNLLDPEYLMMWFLRSEIDRYARFKSHGSAREIFDWSEMCETLLPIPIIEKQREIVKEYNIIQNRIALNQQLSQKLEETAQSIYRKSFIEGIDLENLSKDWKIEKLKNLCIKIGSGSTPTGGKESYSNSGISLIRSTNVFDYNFSYEDLAFINDEQANKLKNVEIQKNDILFNITGVSVARCCMVPNNVLPARVNQHVMIIRPDEKLNISFYMLLNLCSTDNKNALLGISQSGSTREAITKTEIEEFEIIVPDNNKLKEFERQMQKIFSYKDLKSLENQKLIELKELLLSRLATIDN